METRNITIVSTKDQKKTVVATDATTLSELKAALRTAGVSYEGMTFYEGLTHTELLADDSILPHDVEYKGTVTNELVFMLTNPDKKIKSGALSQARAALYSEICERELGDVCVERFGKNLTNCSNSELLQIIEEADQAAQATEAPCCVEGCNVEKALRSLVGILEDSDYLTEVEGAAIIATLEGEANAIASPYSDSDIDDMFEFLNR